MILHTYFSGIVRILVDLERRKPIYIYILYRVVKEKGVEEDFAYSYVYRSTFLNKKESIQINTTKFNTKCLQNQPF